MVRRVVGRYKRYNASAALRSTGDGPAGARDAARGERSAPDVLDRDEDDRELRKFWGSPKHLVGPAGSGERRHGASTRLRFR
jgi:hypothetical protein